MRIIGVTGGFGSGKSFIASLFKKCGAKVINADALAHKALTKGSRSYKRIVSAFGNRVLDAKGAIKRKTLAGIVFNDKKSLARLNKIVHPEVIRKIRGSIRSSAAGEVLVIDAPLICETSLVSLMDTLVVVKASRENQIKRCSKKFHITREDVRKRMACQMPLGQKICMADYVVDNDGAKSRTEKQVREIWQHIKKGE